MSNSAPNRLTTETKQKESVVPNGKPPQLYDGGRGSDVDRAVGQDHLAVATTADFFPRLPPEIRNMVWKLAAFEPRVIKVRYSGGVPANIQQLTPDSPLLQVNREARTFSLKISKPIVKLKNGYNRIYYQPEIDTVLFTMTTEVIDHLEGFAAILVGMGGAPCLGIYAEHLQRLCYHPQIANAFEILKRVNDAGITRLKIVLNCRSHSERQPVRFISPNKSLEDYHRSSYAIRSVCDDTFARKEQPWDMFGAALVHYFESKQSVYTRLRDQRIKTLGMTQEDLLQSGNYQHQAAAYSGGGNRLDLSL